MESQNRRTHKNEFVKATNMETGEVKFYKNGMDASREIGCSHVLAYKVLQSEISTAYGWRLEYIPRDDPQCNDLKKEIEDGIKAKRQAIVKKVLGVRRKMRALKTDRKARHDEIMGLLEQAMWSLKKQKADEIAQYREALARDHAIVQFTMDGELVRKWKNAHQAQKETNIKNIRQVVLGLRQSAGGYRWEFLV